MKTGNRLRFIFLVRLEGIEHLIHSISIQTFIPSLPFQQIRRAWFFFSFQMREGVSNLRTTNTFLKRNVLPLHQMLVWEFRMKREKDRCCFVRHTSTKIRCKFQYDSTKHDAIIWWIFTKYYILGKLYMHRNIAWFLMASYKKISNNSIGFDHKYAMICWPPT